MPGRFSAFGVLVTSAIQSGDILDFLGVLIAGRRVSNDGFIFEERVVTTPGFPETHLQDQFAESQAFHQRFVNPTNIDTLAAQDHDYGFYIQDNWKPNERLSLNLGIRADTVRRYDSLFDVVRMSSLSIGPRLGFSYLVTEDARNVFRARGPNQGQLVQPRGGYDNNSYSQFASSYGPSWRKHAIRLSGLWLAPAGVRYHRLSMFFEIRRSG